MEYWEEIEHEIENEKFIELLQETGVYHGTEDGRTESADTDADSE